VKWCFNLFFFQYISVNRPLHFHPSHSIGLTCYLIIPAQGHCFVKRHNIHKSPLKNKIATQDSSSCIITDSFAYFLCKWGASSPCLDWKGECWGQEEEPAMAELLNVWCVAQVQCAAGLWVSAEGKMDSKIQGLKDPTKYWVQCHSISALT
jgi:hypothetical protein